MPIVTTRLEILQVRKLIQCVRNQDSSQIEKMVAQGIPGLVNFQDADKGYTALHVAVILNLDHVVTQLLDNGASTSVQDLEGCTAVMRACEYGHLQALEALSTKGLSLHVVDLSGNTALFHCLHPTGRHVKCLSFLLEFGANPNVKSTSGRPLVYAVCELGYDKLLEKLLEKGADPNAREADSCKPPVVIACERGHIECVKLLAKYGADLNATYSETELCALHKAASLGHFEIIQVLSACCADFTLASKTNDNAIHFATSAYKLLCVRFLGQRGCPANESNQDGNTPQKLAKNEGFKDVMKELKKLTGFQDKVAKGGKPKGYTEPYLVRLFDWLQINKEVIFNTLNTHESNKDGVIPVDVFTTYLDSLGVPLDEDQWMKFIKIYDKKGEGFINWYDIISDHKYVHAQYKLSADDNIKEKKGKKKGGKKGGKKGKKGKTKVLFPIYYEAERPPTSGISDGCIEREQLVTDYQRFSRDTPLPHSFIDDSAWYLIPPERQYIHLYEAVRHGDIESMMSAFHEGISVDARDKYNKTPLMIACAHGRLDVAKFLLLERADINAIDNFLWTPLHHACHAGEEEIVKLLLDSGANIDTQSYNGGTPLMRAIETSQKSIVKLLIERGAKLSAINKHGETALDVARNWGDDFIYAIVYAKAASLPPPPEAKGKEKGVKEKGGKKGKKGGEVLPSSGTIPGPPLLPLPLSPRLPTPFESLEQTRRRCSFQSLQSDLCVKPSSNYQPKPAWINRPLSTQIFKEEQIKAREERGTESTDFGELRTPFQLQIIARAQALEICDL